MLELTQWTKCLGKKGLSSRPSNILHDNEQPVDNSMTKRWISDEQIVNSTEAHTIHDGRPQSYPRAVLNDIHGLSVTIHAFHRYNNKKQQTIYNLYLGRNASEA
jgi:hypothetical protein